MHLAREATAEKGKSTTLARSHGSCSTATVTLATSFSSQRIVRSMNMSIASITITSTPTNIMEIITGTNITSTAANVTSTTSLSGRGVSDSVLLSTPTLTTRQVCVTQPGDGKN